MNSEQQKQLEEINKNLARMAENADRRRKFIANMEQMAIHEREQYYTRYLSFFNEWVQRDYWTAIEYTLFLNGFPLDVTNSSNDFTPRLLGTLETILNSPVSLGAKEPLPKIFKGTRTLLLVERCLNWPDKKSVYTHTFWRRAADDHKYNNHAINPASYNTSRATAERINQKEQWETSLKMFLNDIDKEAEKAGFNWRSDCIPDLKQQFHKIFYERYPGIKFVEERTLTDRAREFGANFTKGRRSKNISQLRTLFPS